VWPWDFWSWSVVIHGRSRGQPLHQVWRSYGYPFLSWVLTSPIGYHWQCICSHCACAIPRDLRIAENFSHIFKIPDPDLPIHCTTNMALQSGQMELSTKTVYGPVLKITQLSAHAQNHVSMERWHKSFTTIVLSNHDFLLNASNFGNLIAFWTIFSHTFTAHGQKRLFMNFRLKLWHHHSIPWPDFFMGHDISVIWGCFLLIFALDKLNVRHISTSAFSRPTDLESVSCDAYLTMKVSTKFEIDTTIYCLVIALLLLIRHVTLWPWPLTFWPWSVVIHGGSRDQPLFEDPTAIRSWVMSSDISHRIPMTMHLQLLHMRRITWPMRRGQILPTYLKSLTPICLFTEQLLWRYDDV